MSNAPTVPEHHYSVPVGPPGSSVTVEWRWPNSAAAVWVMAEREGCAWMPDGPLTEEGRQAMLTHFKLEEVSDELPLETIQIMAPVTLVDLHLVKGLPVHDPVSDCRGDHIPASHAA